MSTQSRKVGWMFGLAAFIAGAGPMIYNNVGDEAYVVPEPTPLSAADQAVVETAAALFCSGDQHPTIEPTWSNQKMGQDIPVILYHRITDKDSPSHEVIRPKLFREQLDWLKENGYETITVEHLRRYMLNEVQIPKKPIVITFDDGWRDNFVASKHLEKLGFGATFYVVSGFFAVPQYLDQDQLGQMAQNPKFEIGSHSHSHWVKFEGRINQLDLCTVAKEAAASKLILERLIGKPVKSFAWPYGRNTKEWIAAAKAVGFTSTVHVNDDAHNAPGHSPFFIRRMNIDGTCGLEEFKKMVETKVLKECS